MSHSPSNLYEPSLRFPTDLVGCSIQCLPIKAKFMNEHEPREIPDDGALQGGFPYRSPVSLFRYCPRRCNVSYDSPVVVIAVNLRK